jgi:hypothetical protein
MKAEQELTNELLATNNATNSEDLEVGTIVIIKPNIRGIGLRPAVVIKKNNDLYNIEYVYPDEHTLKPIQDVTIDKLRPTIYSYKNPATQGNKKNELLNRLQSIIDGDDGDIAARAYKKGGSRKSKRHKYRHHKKTNRRRKSRRYKKSIHRY